MRALRHSKTDRTISAKERPRAGYQPRPTDIDDPSSWSRVTLIRSSTIRTMTVGPGFAPVSCFGIHKNAAARGLMSLKAPSPPVGNFAPPRRSVVLALRPKHQIKPAPAACKRAGAATSRLCYSATDGVEEGAGPGADDGADDGAEISPLASPCSLRIASTAARKASMRWSKPVSAGRQ